MRISRVISLLLHTDIIKSVLLNFHYFKPKEAVKFPIMVAYRTSLETVRGGKN